MKVYDLVQKQLGELQRPPAPRAGLPKSRSPAAPPRLGGADRVQLSDLADQMRAAAVAEEAHHAARLAQLREMIEAGRYEVDPKEVALAILREEILPWIVR